MEQGSSSGASKGKEQMTVNDSFTWDVGDEPKEECGGGSTLVGKIWTTKAINARAAIESMIKLWHPKGTIVGNLIDARNKIFLFKFTNAKDKERVIDGQPWHFDKYIWCFNEPVEDGKITETPLTHVPIWARVYDLPLRGRSNMENIKRLGMQLGRFVSVDEAPFPEMERAVRLRVVHDVRKALVARVEVRMPTGRIVDFQVKYERLPNFCYGCGILGHGEKECDEGPYEEWELKYGDELRASPWKVVKTIAVNTGNSARCLLAAFEKEARQREEEAVELMIEKLQRVAIKTKGVKPTTIPPGGGGKTSVEKGSWVSRREANDDTQEHGEGERTGSLMDNGGDLELVMTEVEGSVGQGEDDVIKEIARARQGQKSELSHREGMTVGDGGRAYAGRKWTRLPRSQETATKGDGESCQAMKRVREGNDKSQEVVAKKTKTMDDRHLSWQQLRLLAAEEHGPWLCIGDFNEILFSTEMKGGDRAQWQMANFREDANDCGLRDLDFEGYEFTFDNGQARDDNRQSRIDRAMVTDSWTEFFPYAKLHHLGTEWSDHTPLLVLLDAKAEQGEKGGRKFRFEQMWVEEDGCEETIRRAWDPGDDVADNVQRCAKELMSWRGANVGKILRDLKIQRKKLQKLDGCPRSMSNVQERRAIKLTIAKLIKQEEQFWRQRSRVLWLRDGDKNTTYFHRKARQRKKKNRIKLLVDDSGRSFDTEEGMERVAVEYFMNLFETSNPIVTEDVTAGVEGRVSDEINGELREPYTEAEIVDALNQMHPLKAPGPDGMNALFFQTYWHIVGPSIIRACLSILNGHGIPEDTNMTHIILIPKRKEASKMSEFRPISLCNVLYKIVSKVLANRLNKFPGEIVTENQSAFVPGRLITDNILVAFELFHHMKNARGGGGHMALKLDMAKAYDRIEWHFLEETLLAMGFDTMWVRRVMECVASVTYAVTINGSYTECFKPRRGLCQGDPLSPYLFILCAEVFSSMIRREMERGSLHGIRVAPTAPMVFHLFFADDSIIFTKANEREARIVKDILVRYERVSGQLGWRGAMLSKAGKETLIKSIVQAIPTYAMSVFKIPNFFCDEIRSLITSFWWGASNGRKKIPWIAWEKMCRSKEHGGLGFRDFQLFNKALLGKQGWRLMTEDTSLMARVIRGKYFADRGFLEAELGSNPSYSWRSIWESKEVIMLGARKRIGDGWSTNVWLDPWIPNTQSRRVISPRNGNDEVMKVAHLMKPDRTGWNDELLDELFLPFEKDRIRNIRLCESSPTDDWCWDPSKDGEYTVKSAYHLLFDQGEHEEQSEFARDKWLWNTIWRTPVLPRVKLFIWQLCHDALPTRNNIGRRLGLSDVECPFCSNMMETCLHMLRDCGWVYGVWEGVGMEEQVEIRVERVREWVDGVLRESGEEERMRFMLRCWAIWERRNSVIFEGGERKCGLVIRRVQDLL
ncbi:uncharacterized protein LOC141641287 [Silene latifolia]|uniref:uncharacterized protein LOC141641287 n=1 Tax=Silene latifolia TaxID=37657 RepID=UPI003D7760A6